MEPRIAKTLENLRANGFQALYFASKEEATTWLCQQVQRGEKVAFGGSVTLRKLHLRESLEQKGALFLDPYATKDPKKTAGNAPAGLFCGCLLYLRQCLDRGRLPF